MREIKFRAWDAGEKKMRHSGYIGASGIYYSGLIAGGLNPTKTKDYIPMQFTGLTDKNGKEIYEGDVVLHADSPHGPLQDTYKYSIVWNDSGFALLSPKTEIPTSFILDKKWGALLEVIGNIYENPDLLN